MTGFSERLRELRKRKKLKQRELAFLLGLSVSAISMYEREERKPTYDIVQEIADLFDVSVDYLLGRSENLFPTHEQNKSISTSECNSNITHSIVKEEQVKTPFLGSIRAGQPLQMIQEVNPEYELVDKSLVRSYDSFVLTVKGHSMIGDQIYDGDRVVVIRTPHFSAKDICVVAINDEEACLKRVKLQGDQCILSSSNPDIEPMIYPAKDVQVLGVVVEVRHRIHRSE
ncbi:hypothetical protein SD51_13795 [Alicyclobacillus tengchongensis]|nr:hypothetical protein SD51_13795 [Alicyclobacillus tengchongensis]